LLGKSLRRVGRLPHRFERDADALRLARSQAHVGARKAQKQPAVFARLKRLFLDQLQLRHDATDE